MWVDAFLHRCTWLFGSCTASTSQSCAACPPAVGATRPGGCGGGGGGVYPWPGRYMPLLIWRSFASCARCGAACIAHYMVGSGHSGAGAGWDRQTDAPPYGMQASGGNETCLRASVSHPHWMTCSSLPPSSPPPKNTYTPAGPWSAWWLCHGARLAVVRPSLPPPAPVAADVSPSDSLGTMHGVCRTRGEHDLRLLHHSAVISSGHGELPSITATPT